MKDLGPPQESKLSDIFGKEMPSHDQRTDSAIGDPEAQRRFREISGASEVDRPELEAQAAAYLAAAHQILPEEAKVIFASITKDKSKPNG